MMKPIFYSITVTLMTMALLSSCGTYEKKISDAPTAIERKQYAVAVSFLKQNYEKAADKREKGKIALQMGDCYTRMGQHSAAIDYYKQANDAFIRGASLKYARALKRAERYKEAIEVFREAEQEADEPSLIQEQIQACKSAEKWKSEKDKNTYKVLGRATFSTDYADYAPVLYADSSIVFSHDAPARKSKDKKAPEPVFKWTGLGFSDFVSSRTENNASLAQLNTPYNEGSLTFNADYSEVYFTRCGSDAADVEIEYCKIYHATRQGDSWKVDEQALKLGSDNANYGHPFLSPEGKGLYFASDKSDGFGGYDLYFTFKNQDGSWAEARNMGADINTAGNEMFPVLDADTLYFSSDGQAANMGGLDIYRAVKKDGRFKSPQNLKSPINSGSDDFGLMLIRRKTPGGGIRVGGYFTSARPQDDSDNSSDDDIYEWAKIYEKPAIVNVERPKVKFKLILDGIVQGKFTDDKGDVNISPLASQLIKVSTTDTAFTVTADAKGKFTFPLRPETNYHLEAIREGYFTGVLNFSSPELPSDPNNPEQTVSVALLLNKIIYEQEIVLEDIYYDFDKANIREDAKPSLNRLVTILKQNPKINIELASHTDCRGNDAYNLALSQKRAESAVRYLIENGIAAERLSAKGYGETSPRESCDCRRCTDEQHQANRRTGFRVVAAQE